MKDSPRPHLVNAGRAGVVHFGADYNAWTIDSAGGVVPAQEAARKPVLLVASGPAGGVMGSLQLAQEIGHANIITTDMGGTSFDVALVVDGKPLVSGTHEVGGFHLNTPVTPAAARSLAVACRRVTLSLNATRFYTL